MSVSQKIIGCCKCTTGLVGCPVYSLSSFLLGTFYCVAACATQDYDHCYTRQQVCMCCGVATGLMISATLMTYGWYDCKGEDPPIRNRENNKTYPQVENDMIR